MLTAGLSGSCISNHKAVRDRGARALRPLRDPHERIDINLAARVAAQHLRKIRRKRFDMAKRGRKKRDRKYSKANHGKRPNA
jgi:hypothetical protein